MGSPLEGRELPDDCPCCWADNLLNIIKGLRCQSTANLFGLHTVPAQLSRYDETGLCWLLDGREVVALTADTATVRNPKTSNLTVYRRHNKPALACGG